ncbi:MAG TPA: methyltransferase [Ktedonobacterales bacterium]|nr:methyltransferase [Ktedonobacterales bacterium]
MSQSSGQADDAPQRALFDLIFGYRATQLVALAARLEIAERLADGPRSSKELAHATQTQPEALYRALRALASLGVFAELDGRRFALTPLGERLQATHPESVRPAALFAGAEAYHAWAELPYSVATGQTGFDHLYGASHFAWLTEHPEENALFNQVMTAGSPRAADAVVAAYDFGERGTVVDVAGGQGLLLATILRAHTGLRGVLFDLPHVVASAGPTLQTAGVVERCEIVSGDFFAHVPSGGDIYTLRRVIHDWDDERAVAILRNCAQALGPQGRIAVIEQVMPSGPGKGPGAGRAASLDVQMLIMTGGHERTAEEFARLFSAAGLRLTRIIPTQAGPSVIEGML